MMLAENTLSLNLEEGASYSPWVEEFENNSLTKKAAQYSIRKYFASLLSVVINAISLGIKSNKIRYSKKWLTLFSTICHSSFYWVQ